MPILDTKIFAMIPNDHMALYYVSTQVLSQLIDVDKAYETRNYHTKPELINEEEEIEKDVDFLKIMLCCILQRYDLGFYYKNNHLYTQNYYDQSEFDHIAENDIKDLIKYIVKVDCNNENLKLKIIEKFNKQIHKNYLSAIQVMANNEIIYNIPVF